MTHGSLFSGIGGFDLAAEWAGWENVFHCECEPFAQKVLKHHFPKSKLYNDIKTFDATDYFGRIDIITGGFPCQPFSTAGERKGTEDERYLWKEMLRIIREVAPKYVVGENVRGLLNWSGGMVFEQVCADLEAEGYEVAPYLLPACGKNAPHRRDRIWFIAYSNNSNDGRNTRKNETEGSKKWLQERNEYGSLLSQVKYSGLIPTPCARDIKGTNSMEHLTRETGHKNHLNQLPNYIKFQTGKSSQLNPLFVEQMMGFPKNWTASPFLSGEKKA